MSAYPLRFARLLLVQMTMVMLTLASFAYWESQRTMELVLTHVPDFPAVGHELHQTNQAFLAKMILVIAAAAIIQLFFGFYMSGERKMVMNIATGTGTLAHELVHPLLAEDFPNVSSWFNEGFASLYEQSGSRGSRMMGFVNWRLPGLH